MSSRRIIELVTICGLFLLNNLAPADGCPPRALVAMKSVFSSRTHTVNGPSCYALSSLRTVGDSEGTYENSGAQSFKSCRDLCKAKGHSAGQIIAMEQDMCHCDKEFKRKGAADVSKCPNVCPGRIEERCGGPDHISAYPIDYKISY